MEKKRHIAAAIFVLFGMVVFCVFYEAKRRTDKETSRLQSTKSAERKMNAEEEEQSADSMVKVVLCTTDYQSRYHAKVVVTSDKEFYVIRNGIKKQYDKKTKVTILSEDAVDGKIQIQPGKNGRLKILSIKRQGKNPKYRGKLLLYQQKNGLVLVNRLSVEEYLYSVVSSEIETDSAAVEAVKAQAVCARTYVYQQIYSKRYKEYHADVDDSSACQVYNNVPENAVSRSAVKQTAGKVLKKGSSLINTYYYSTSWGYSASGQDVWDTQEVMSYLPEQLQTEETKRTELSLKKESDFRKFIDREDNITYDSSFAWYRWNVCIPEKNLTARINSILQLCYRENPDKILTQTKTGKYIKKEIKQMGRIRKIRIEQRQKSGLVTQIVIAGKKNVVKVCDQYNIRRVLGSIYETIYYNKGKSKANMKLLPSAAFYIDRIQKGNEVCFEIVGGGFGHGTGMSQSGAVKQAKKGKTCEEILQYYFSGAKQKDVNEKSVN